MDSKKELVVPRIENGTVIDHIPTTAVYKVIRILGLEKYQDQVLIGNYLNSEKLGKKGIIKINNKHFSKEEMGKIALVAPYVTIIDIKDFAVTGKFTTEIPDHVENFVKCANPKCITNFEQIPTQFDIVDKVNLKLKCHYCEKFTTKDTMVILDK